MVIQQAEADAIAAAVRGSAGARYAVRIRVVDEGDEHPALEVSCTCPRFTSGHACKHLFALLVVLDHAPHGLEVPGSGRLRLARTDGFLDAEEDEELESEDLEEEGEETASSVRQDSARRRGDDFAWLGAPRPFHAPRAALASRQLLYVVSPDEVAKLGRLRVLLMQRERNRHGNWTQPRAVSIRTWEIDHSFFEPDRGALSALAGCAGEASFESYYRSYSDGGGTLSARTIPAGLQGLVVPLLARTGRLCELAPGSEEPRPFTWDGDIPHAIRLRFVSDDRPGELRLEAELHGSAVRRPDQLRFVLSSGLALAGDRFVRIAESALHGLLEGFRRYGPIAARAEKLPALLERMTEFPLPQIDGLAALGWSDETGAPQPELRIEKPAGYVPQTLLYGRVGFEYAGTRIGLGASQSAIADLENRRLLRRDPEREAALLEELFALGCKPLRASAPREDDKVRLSRKRMPELVAALIGRGWRVEAQGVRIRRAGAPRLSVRSGIDWFELEGTVEFEGESATIPALLAAVERGETTVVLGDGSLGLLPAEWLARVAPLTELGERADGGVRFRASQALLLDALLASEPVVDVDRAFREACQKLTDAAEPRSRETPPGFSGELRPYQRAGLGWLHYLGGLGLGACLADDMGLGKTVQVLALFAERYCRDLRDAATSPSLVVAPSSVVANWLAEAERFTPGLRVLDFTGSERAPLRDQLTEHDVVITSYGTLRAEIEKLAGIRFDKVVLDEAQAIKNAAAKTSKAARLLRAERRIALSGTPVENHLGELWALFDFLNPGLLGASARAARTLDDLGEAGVTTLARALRPFILRRTKRQVLAELPPKTEQTLYCELEGAERRHYEELRRHFRARVLREVEHKGLARSKIHVLEALLRLRQAACHPGLIDPKRARGGSAKLDLLLEQLAEALDEGHKALVFSQFTSLLAIVRAHLDARGVPYEYLDGKTRDRANRVQRFQEDPACRLFLVSLKAGGLGLNLTAADYVFLLDPWWNPAVESQAVDRAHRIGQTQPVFAYRIVARNTIEEKILLLQEGKRRLADAILSADPSVLRSLTREDLELLLG